LYLFTEWNPWVLFVDLFMMFDDVVSWDKHIFMFYDLRIFYGWRLYDTLVLRKVNVFSLIKLIQEF